MLGPVARSGMDEPLTSDFDYPLPEDRIARRPAPRRGDSRLLVVSRDSGTLEDRRFADLAAYLAPGDALVLNDSRVFPARLLGQKPTGARVEVLLVRPRGGSTSGPAEPPGQEAAGEGPRIWEAWVRPGAKLKPGRRVEVAPGFAVEILDSLADGSRLVRLLGAGDPWELVERHGRIPLPPYLRRPDDAEDRERYQTVYARVRGSVAAPTAGLHFDRSMLSRLVEKGVRIVRITLHVGPGTFRPVDAERPGEHEMDAEWFRVGSEAAETLAEVRRAGHCITAVGTTVVRALESAVAADGSVRPTSGWTNLFIYPSFRFRVVDRLLTNFHLPRSSLLMLVCAFAGREHILRAYDHAVANGYRFYSYGDAMLVR